MPGTAATASTAIDDAGMRLVQAAASGDRSAFVTLHERYGLRLHNFAYRVTGSEPDATAATESALLSVTQDAPALQDDELGFGTQLFWATYAACHQLMDGRPTALPNDPTPLREPHREVDVRDANMRLPERQRAALALSELEGLPYGEIAAIMAMSRGAVAKLVFRARINLLDELSGTPLAGVSAPPAECERALPLIAARSDGQLDADPRDAAWLDDHLTDCDRCGLAVEAMREAARSYRIWVPLAAVPALSEATVAKASERSEAARNAAETPPSPDESPVEPGPDPAGTGGGRPRRRHIVLAAGSAALLLLAGLAIAVVNDDPATVPVNPAAKAAPKASAGTPKPRVNPTRARRSKDATAGRRAKPGQSTTTAVPVEGANPISAQAASGGYGGGGESASSEPASRPTPTSGKTTVQPTRRVSAPKQTRTPRPAVTPTPPPPVPAPAPVTTPPAPQPAPVDEPPRRREPPGKPADRPPG